MKALPMLDHVMLWVARLSAFGLFLPCVYFFLTLGLGLVFAYNLPLPGNPFLIVTVFAIAASALLISSFWFLHKAVARIFMIVFSSVFIGLIVYSTFTDWSENSLFWKMVGALSLLGFVSWIWTALRPPYPLPQSS